ncbi:MAG: phage tail tape measure protein, partial [Treponema sp.]|nr:phage tail tape measure protein [Treponema sp.]
MPANYQIKTQFLLEDKATKVLEAIGLKGSVFSKGLLQAEKRWSALGEVAKKAAVGIAAAGAAAVGAGIVTATRKFIAFDDALSSAGAHFADLDVSADDYGSHLDELKEKALEVSGATRFNATDTIGALDKMAMAGFSSAQAMAMLAGTANMATAAGVDLTSGVDMVTDAMGAFNLVKDELGRPLETAALEANLNRMGDVVSLATKKANFDMNMWFESVKNGAPVFSSYGGTLEDFTAMAGTLANVGIKGGEAGTALRNVMQRLATPTSTAAKA